MNIIRTSSYEEMSMQAAKIIIKQVKNNPALTLGLATGSTPIGLYKELINDHHNNGTSYKDVHTINLDEYIGLPKDNPSSYHFFMKHQLFNYIDLPIEQTNVPNGTAEDLERECERYEEKIRQLGGIDLQILGIGQNGHIGFNEPGTSFESRTHIVQLTENTIEVNSRFFNTIDEVPTKSITMGIQTILECKEIILLASGASKAKAIARMINGPVSEEFPASCLKKHPNVTIIADSDALQLV
ncbi:glucosamine-6-phosphate deaminase [Bacillus aquiflavi]|uniref:Glucosamine-6-phosphate deaminase n=1 Tax=Bacillus aquiflavi TaxID=2672567 RepID=A0A6B3W1N3_9BACI|nr:glucosamine-6-phosphate deaminase [Bacillus aquiflavi]MBA4537554.1 glucosamine-6-phosphate deaminase [Bacillus aquiflavi]NEY81811.1 glucosamine-6-phosphate deaminase [Bacillus aquiflavi]UAC47829.1 glucosamine-6-phosphate deaminase [Bacillus aquiflavi]